MKKTFCDSCEREIDTSNNGKWLQAEACRGGKRLNVRIETTGKDSDADTDVCKHCVFDVIYSLDGRPRAVSQ